MNLPQKQFIRYGRVASETEKINSIGELSDLMPLLSNVNASHACKIEWMSE